MFRKSSALTYDQKQYIIKYCGDKTINELADELGVKYTTIHAYITCKELQFKKQKTSSKKLPDSFEVNGYFSTENYSKIAII